MYKERITPKELITFPQTKNPTLKFPANYQIFTTTFFPLFSFHLSNQKKNRKNREKTERFRLPRQ